MHPRTGRYSYLTTGNCLVLKHRENMLEFFSWRWSYPGWISLDICKKPDQLGGHGGTSVILATQKATTGPSQVQGQTG